MKYARIEHRHLCRHAVDLRPRMISDVLPWCTKQNGRGMFFILPTGRFMFEDSDTALAFKMRWAGEISTSDT